MLNRNEHDRLVAGLYASALGETPWRETIACLASAFGTTGSLVQIHDSEDRILSFVAYPFSAEFAAAFYASEIYRSDPRFGHFLNVRPGSIYYDHALYDVEEMNRDPRVRACNDAVSTNYSLGMVAGLPDGATAFLSLLSTEAEGHASAAAIQSFRRLAPHLKQALSLGQIVEHRAATHAAMLEALARRVDGVILLDRKGTPCFMNDAARAILAASDGLAYSRDRFVTLRGPETRRLQQLIGDAVALLPASESRPGGEILVTRSGGLRPYVLRVMSAARTEQFLTAYGVACVLHLRDLAAIRQPDPALLTAAFGLTEREADLAVELVRCASLVGAAANAGMALNTARNHLQGLFRKTGTASQAEAVQLFSRLA